MVDKLSAVFWAILTFIWGAIFGFVTTEAVVSARWHSRLIDAGVAHYEMVEGGPDTRFVIDGEADK